jgi:Spy/CpxP family protein refolding chaperone
MKKLLFTVLGFVALNLAVSAQIDREPGANAGGRGRGNQQGMDRKQKMKGMVKELNLSKEQMGQLKDMNRDLKQQMQAIKADQTLSDEQRREKVKAINKTRIEKLKTILTPQQFEQLKAKVKANKDKMADKKAQENGDDIFAELDNM